MGNERHKQQKKSKRILKGILFAAEKNVETNPIIKMCMKPSLSIVELVFFGHFHKFRTWQFNTLSSHSRSRTRPRTRSSSGLHHLQSKMEIKGKKSCIFEQCRMLNVLSMSCIHNLCNITMMHNAQTPEKETSFSGSCIV